jgi:hypothetical protein
MIAFRLVTAVFQRSDAVSRAAWSMSRLAAWSILSACQGLTVGDAEFKQFPLYRAGHGAVRAEFGPAGGRSQVGLPDSGSA